MREYIDRTDKKPYFTELQGFNLSMKLSFGFVLPCPHMLLSHLCHEELLLLPAPTTNAVSWRGDLLVELVCLASGIPEWENSFPWHRRNMCLLSCNLTCVSCIMDPVDWSGLCGLKWTGTHYLLNYCSKYTACNKMSPHSSMIWPRRGGTEGGCWENWTWNEMFFGVGEVLAHSRKFKDWCRRPWLQMVFLQLETIRSHFYFSAFHRSWECCWGIGIWFGLKLLSETVYLH